MFTTKKDGNHTIFEFDSGSYHFMVSRYDGANSGRWWTVYRVPKGCQRNLCGKTFHQSVDMIAHYKTASVQLAMIANN